MRYYWFRGDLRMLVANVSFWTAEYRPLAAFYYLPLHHFFGLGPKPYHIARLIILAINGVLIFCLARLLTRSRLAAGATVLLSCYHAKAANLVYWSSFIYDVLCGTFFFAALAFYLAVRRRRPALSGRHTLIFLLLYICALNAKEMAVSLPVLVLFYELITFPPANWKASTLVEYCRRQCAPALLAGLFTALYIHGKTTGPNALSNMEAYRPVYTFARFQSSNAHYLSEIFYVELSNPRTLWLVWGALFYLAWRRYDPILRLAALWVVLTPLPIAFLSGRGAACLYIVIVGWAIVASVLFVRFARVVARQPLLQRIPPSWTVTALSCICVALVFHETRQHHIKEQPGWMITTEDKTWRVIRQLQALHLHPKHGSNIVFLDNPFNGYELLFIAELLWNDHSVNITLQDYAHHTPEQLAKMDYAFASSHDRIELIVGPK